MKFLIFVIMLLVFGGLVSSVDFEELTEVEKSALFDIFVEIPSEYHVVDIDGDILFTLKLVNLGGAGRIDVFLEYSLINSDGDVVLDKRETVAIETQASFLREFDLEGIPVGDYDIYAKLVYADGKEADSRHSFEIRRVVSNEMWLIGFVVAGILVIVGIIFLYPKIKLIRDKMRIRSRVREIVGRVEVR